MPPKKIEKFSPLTESTFYILISLYEPAHGYGIMQKVERMSNGRVVLGPGTMYGALSNLQKNMLIASLENKPGDRKKMYEITEFGKELVEYEVKRLKEIIKNAEKITDGSDDI